jgi:hypothetical protein
MENSFERLKARRSRLPDPPDGASNNLRAPEVAPASEDVDMIASEGRQPPALLNVEPRPRIDGRARLRKDRTEALSTKIKRHHRDLLMSLADAYETTLSETLEKAIEALAERARHEGKEPR